MARFQPKRLRRVALIGTCLPRQCGIATFSRNLRRGIEQASPGIHTPVVSVNDIEHGYRYSDEVCFEIEERELASYHRAADFLNLSNTDVVCVQHEFGIYGGPSGNHIVKLIRQLRMPVVTTLHTILQSPADAERRAMKGLIEHSDLLVTMTERGGEFLRDIYDAPPERIRVIPHGIPDVSFVDPSFYKDKFGLEGRHVMLTFGLIGPGKGIEQMIEAMPAVVQRHPNTTYVILGATHPQLKRERGEIYRIGLQRQAEQLGVQENVVFHNRFVSDEELNEFLGAAEIYITPYLNKAQICSGSLAYALGAGKAVVSTPYWHAEEALADGRGRLVPFDDAAALADAVIDLLDHPTQLAAMRKRAYLYGREMTWANVGRSYVQMFTEARKRRSKRPSASVIIRAEGAKLRGRELPLIRLDHVHRMTDQTGILQHAVYSIPNLSEGYCTDDNARALILVLSLRDLVDGTAARLPELNSRYVAFLEYAFNPERNRFRNFLSFSRVWLDEVGSEDSHGRAIWALGTLVAAPEAENHRMWAAQLFARALEPVLAFTSPRAWAFTLLGIDGYLRCFEGDWRARRVLGDLSGRLLKMYRANSSPDWRWFEDCVTYSNAKLPHAMLLSGTALRDEDMVEAAIQTLEWLVDLQTDEAGHFISIGSDGFFKRGSARARFDQQPVEAHATVSACLAAWRLTGEERWRTEARRAFEWFLGRNDLGRAIYDSHTTGCFDGLQPNGVYQNQGAESTLAFVLALAEMHLAEHDADLEETTGDTRESEKAVISA